MYLHFSLKRANITIGLLSLVGPKFTYFAVLISHLIFVLYGVFGFFFQRKVSCSEAAIICVLDETCTNCKYMSQHEIMFVYPSCCTHSCDLWFEKKKKHCMYSIKGKIPMRKKRVLPLHVTLNIVQLPTSNFHPRL